MLYQIQLLGGKMLSYNLIEYGIWIAFITLIPILVVINEEIRDKEHEEFLKEVYGENYDKD